MKMTSLSRIRKSNECDLLRSGMLGAALALGSLVPASSLFATPPADDDFGLLPIDGPHLSVAALVQPPAGSTPDESAPSADIPVTPPTDAEQKASLREALNMLSEKDELELSGKGPIDPADDVSTRSIFSDRKTELIDGRFSLPPLTALTTSTSEIGNGEVPLGFRGGAAEPIVQLPESGAERSPGWQWRAHHWAAANTFSHPLYFEDRMLERHGHYRHPCLQPLISGTRFLGQAVSLPYLGAISPPSTCEYSLGYYRAGSCVPGFLQRPPYQRKALAAQTVAIGTAIAILP